MAEDSPRPRIESSTGPVSVVMPVYNGRTYLTEQVNSILSQLEPGDELIFVDDASTDGSIASLELAASSSVRIVSNPVNVGLFRSLQRGLGLALNDIVFLADQDDVWLPGKRAAFVSAFAADPEICLVISDAEVIDGKGDLIAASFMEARGGFDGSVLGTLWRNRYLGCAMAVRRRLLEAALPIPRLVPMHDMWFGVVARMTGRVEYLPKPYLRYRRHGGNQSPGRSRSPWRLFTRRVKLLSMLALRALTLWSGLHIPAGRAMSDR